MSAGLLRPRSTRILTITIAATLGGAVLLAGCGGGGGDDETTKASAQTSPQASDAAGDPTASTKPSEPYAGQSASDIYTMMRKKAVQAKSVHLMVNLPKGKQALDADLSMNRAGKATGSLTIPSEGSMKVITVGNQKGYFQPGKDMYEKMAGGNEAAIKLLAGKWISFGKGDGMEDVTAMVNMDHYIDDMLSPLADHEKPTMGKGRKLAGRQTILLREKGNPTVLYVAADGSGELVGIKDSDGQMTFSDWNKPVTAKAPAKSLNLKDFQ